MSGDSSQESEKTYKPFIEQQLFVALIEQAIFIYELRIADDVRDSSAFDFHLWLLKRHLTKNEIEKPAEILAVVLEKAHAAVGPEFWKVTTIKNRCSKAEALVEESKRKGACHEPATAGGSAGAKSPKLAQALGGGCKACEAIWFELLQVSPEDEAAISVAAKAISNALPDHADRIKSIVKSIQEMPLEELVSRLPAKLQIGFPNLFDGVISI